MNENNDAEYIVDAIEKVKAAYPNIDASRVYVFGIATGGFMASRLACQKPEYFRADRVDSWRFFLRRIQMQTYKGDKFSRRARYGRYRSANRRRSKYRRN